MDAIVNGNNFDNL